jgi:hypothetical protein
MKTGIQTNNCPRAAASHSPSQTSGQINGGGCFSDATF